MQASYGVTTEKTKVDQLFEAVDAKDLKKVKLLISGGLSPDVKNKAGMQVIPAMMQRSYMSERVEIVNYLIEMGANINHIVGSGDTMLHHAVTSEMYSTILLLIKKNIDIKAINNFGEPALFSAKSIKMLKFLIDNNIGTINDLDDDGGTLLHNAIGFKTDFDMLDYLLKYMDINVRDGAGNTVLMRVLSSSLFPESTNKTVDYLLLKGADVNIVSNNGRTALLTVFRNSALGLQMVKKLIKAGADIKHKDNNGLQALHYAAGNNFNYTKFCIDKNIDINVLSNDKETPLMIASKYNQNNIVEYLLAHGANVNIKNYLGKTALNYAQENDSSDLAQMLKNRGAVATEQVEIDSKLDELNKIISEQAKNKKNEINNIGSAIKEKNLEATKKYYIETINDSKIDDLDMYELASHTIRYGSLEILKYFLENGLDINSKDEEGYSLLHDAVFYDRLKMAEFLVKSGLDVNYHSTSGRSIFAMTAHSSVKMLEFLINNGLIIDKEKEDKIASSALFYRNPEMAEYFINKGYKFDKTILKRQKYLLELIQYQDTETIKYLIKKRLDIETKIFIYGNKATLLHVAVMIEANEVVDFLLAAGANANARNTNNEPLVSHAISIGDLHVIEALYDNGANIDEKIDNYDQTPLLLALRLKRIKIIKILIEKGADVNAVGRGGNTALHVAAQRGYLNALKDMVNKGGNVHLLNKDRKAPLDEAIKYEQKSTIAYLTEMENKT